MGLFGRSKTSTTHRDPVCGMTVDAKTAAGSEEHDGTKFYFCSQTCHETFQKDSHRYGHGH